LLNQYPKLICIYLIKFIFSLLQTALHISAHIGCPKNIQTLLNYNANLMLRDSNGFTALDIALNAENTACSKLLKDASGEINNKFIFIHLYCLELLSISCIRLTIKVLCLAL